MKVLKVNFDCLEGYYEMYIQYGDSNVEYAISSNIHAFDNIDGKLEIQDFEKKIEEIGIEKWNREYLPGSEGIEDSVKWKVKLVDGEKEYVTSGEESFYPYTFNKLMELLKLIDNKLEYFE